MHQCFIQDPKRYTDHFSWLLTRPRFRGGQSRLTDDITPSYAVLNAETLGEIKTNFEQCGIPVKPVFLMREPLERLISSQRMKLRKQDLRDPASEVETLRHRVAKGLCLHGGYGQTLDALDLAFGLEHCLNGIFELCSHQRFTNSSAHFWGSPLRSQSGLKKTSAPPQL